MTKRTVAASAAFLLFSHSLWADQPLEDAVALIESGRFTEAEPLLETSKDPARHLWQGRLAFLNYDFPQATRLYGQYAKARGKSAPVPEAELFSRQLSLASQALESVAEIEVIDSIAVPATDFLSAIRLPSSAGTLAGPDRIPVKGREDISSSVFFNELGNFALWAEPDSTGVYRITESSRLVDGSWSEPIPAPEILNQGGDTDYPFMCADGTTLYYAADGDESIGGFDIFVATRTADDGEYLRPRNIGMPFNSPFDDFMMAIDEENGVGWWVTDRNRLGDKLTLYVYRLADSRTNIDPDNPKLIELARLDDISLTRDDETDYRPLLRTIAGITPKRPPKPVDFHFMMPGRGELTSYSDLRSNEGRSLMKQYLGMLNDFNRDDARLSELRRKYHDAVGSGGRNALSREILDLEKKNEASMKALAEMRNRIYSAEGRK